MSSIAKPFGILLMFLYNLVNNYGLALILFAAVIRIILLPFQMKSKRGMMKQARLQPKMAELQKKHGTNKAKINEEMAKLYKEEGVNPASGCLWSFLPLPIMLALFLVIREPLTMMLGVAAELLASEPEVGAIFAKLQELGFQSTVQPYYIQVDQAQFISANFSHFAGLSDALRPLDFNFGLLNLGAQPQWNFLWTTDWGNSSVWLPGLVLFIIPLFSAGSQFLATILNKKINPVVTPEGQGGSMQTMLMLMPLMSVYFAFITPAALGFYWTVGTLLQIVQDYFLTQRYKKILDAEDAVKNEERKIKEAELEAKRIETDRKKAEGLAERNPNTSKRRMQNSEKQEQLERASEWEKQHAPSVEESKEEPSRVGQRRYARGRAYDPDRFLRNAEDSEQEDEDNEDLSRDIKLLENTGDEVPDIDGDDSDFNDDDDDDDTGDLYDGGDSDDIDDLNDGGDSGSGDDDGDNSDTGDSEEISGSNDEGDDGDGDGAPDSTPTIRFNTTRFDEDER